MAAGPVAGERPPRAPGSPRIFGSFFSALPPGGGRGRRRGGKEDPLRPAAATLAVSGAAAWGRRQPLPAWELRRSPVLSRGRLLAR